MPAILHTLNTLRVIAEYCIVSFHIYFGHPDSSIQSWDLSQLIASQGIAVDFMSLFFVLSGFMSVYTMSEYPTWTSRFHYVKRKCLKVYPIYFCSLILGLPRYIAGILHTRCLTHELISVGSQLLLLQCWMGYGFVGTNSPSWYISSLFWLWLAFPNMCVDRWLKQRPWTWICILYVLSILASAVFIPFSNSISRQLPVIRIFDFLIGCATAYTLEQPIHGISVLILLCIYCAYACCTVVYRDTWDKPPEFNNTCGFWNMQNTYDIIPSRLVTVTSVVWSFCIHFLASREIAQSENIVVKVFSFDFFKSLSLFSLQLYLFHFPMDSILQGIFKELNIHMWLSKDLIVIWCYSMSYAVYVHVQPVLDRLVGNV